jgi:hypothetical protein
MSKSERGSDSTGVPGFVFGEDALQEARPEMG